MPHVFSFVDFVVNALTQLEDLMKQKDYKEVAQSLSVCSIEFAVETLI